MKTYYVYIMSNFTNSTLYVGVTNDIVRRVYEHKNKLVEGFTERYNINKLVYVEECNDINAALEREKQIKRWRREKKVAIINELNPEWRDLSSN